MAVPVLGAGLIIAGGAVVPRFGAESLLGHPGFAWLGKRSYSLYLWHWPVLIIAAEHFERRALPVGENLVLVGIALLLAMVTYQVVENPVRRWRLPSAPSVVLGLVLVVGTVAGLTLVIAAHGSSTPREVVVPAPDEQAVLRDVAAAPSVRSLPARAMPFVAAAPHQFGGNGEPSACSSALSESQETVCTLGDPHGVQLMVVYGDSHALMWLPALNGLTKAAHMRLVVLGKPYCPASLITVVNPPGVGNPSDPYRQCDDWHRWAVGTIRRLRPAMVVISQNSYYEAVGTPGAPSATFSPVAWGAGLTRLIDGIARPDTKMVLLGNIPMLAVSGPQCLAAHPHDVQACSLPVAQALLPLDPEDRAVAHASGLAYVDPTPWFCSATCTALVGHFSVYLDRYHVSAPYAKYLQNALAAALGVEPVG